MINVDHTMKPFNCWLWGFLILCFAEVAVVAASSATGMERPNILWIVTEDINPHLGCFGDPYATTPNLDQFAKHALRYVNCWSAAPVCAPARTSLITGVYPTSTGTEHMRSEVAGPPSMKMFPQFLREQGYYCSNNNKEDYNLSKPGKVWDDSSRSAHWRNRQPGQPFFSVFNIEITHESQIRTRPHVLEHDPTRAPLPSYHPDTPEVRHDWAQYYDNITEMDGIFARKLQEVREAGLLTNTIIFFYGDNGSGMPRSKRWPYNSGLSVPLIVSVPENFRQLATSDYNPGAKTARLVSFVDFAPTLLSLAGIQPPQWMQGHAFMGRYEDPPQKYLYGFRGRMDERYDLVRSVRNERYIYIRNYLPHLIYGQHLAYMFETPTTRVWKELYDQGKLKPPQTFFWQPKPAEELYDLQADPDEVMNLVGSTSHQAILNELRNAQRLHMLQTRDAGFLTEAEQHLRAAGSTIYELAQDARRYPLDEIMAMAEIASQRTSNAMPQLEAGLKAEDSGVRYWAATGILIRGAGAVTAAALPLRQALKDSSPSVRIAAATALGKFGGDADLQLALAALRDLASPEQNGAYVALQALNAIDSLGNKAGPLLSVLKSMPVRDPTAPPRANSYAGRLVSDLTGEAQQASPAPKRGGQKRK